MKHSLENANINVMQTKVASFWEHGFFVRYRVLHLPASPPPHSSGRGSRLAGFDALFNMGSARCKIEWNDNFEATYLKN